MSKDPLIRRLSSLTSLSATETKALAQLQFVTRPILRSREILSAGRKCDEIYVLQEGVAIRYRVLHDGRRQVLNIVLPGDVIGFPACFFETALYSITTLTPAVVSCVPIPALFGLFRHQPRLAAALFTAFSCETAMYAEHLIDVGRRSARERVAHFLLELLTRLQAIGEADAHSFRMPLTQELIGDALGLSLPHVNRTLRQLREEKLLTIDGSTIVIENFDALATIADFENTYLGRIRLDELLAGDPSAAED